MTLIELKQFLDDCIDKQIPFPRNTMQVVLDDFFESVPEEYHGTEQLEYNHKKGQEFVRVFISPDRSKMVQTSAAMSR